MSMATDTENLGESVVGKISYLVYYVYLLQNATGIVTKCGKCLLQNATFLTKCVGIQL